MGEWQGSHETYWRVLRGGFKIWLHTFGFPHILVNSSPFFFRVCQRMILILMKYTLRGIPAQGETEGHSLL